MKAHSLNSKAIPIGNTKTRIGSYVKKTLYASPNDTICGTFVFRDSVIIILFTLKLI